MQYFISFLEGFITFVSPCLLPMLPVYVSYFAGSEHSLRKTLQNALGFVAGFTVVFVLLGALAGTLGSLLHTYNTAVNIVTGLVVVFFGLHFLGVFRFNLFRGMKSGTAHKDMGFFASVLFGLVFSVGWTPCVGAFLGSALLLASQQGHVLTGVLMLLSYSLGLGIPFVASAMLIDKLKSTFNKIKQHYTVINRICGLLLIVMGVLMMTGLLNRFILLFN